MGEDSEMSKPVAWISQDVLDADHIIKAVVRREQDEQHTIPLYTHPVKELTDEEIQEVAQALIDDCSYCALHFARAILRKVQKK
jgi:ActR/RegA family two-component response regulator